MLNINVGVRDIYTGSNLMSAAIVCWRLLCVSLGMFSAHPPFSSKSLGPSAPEEAYSKNVRASGT